MIGSSNVGKVRNDNQDSYMIDTLNNGISYAVVCDGMGGANGGKTASVTAVNSFADYISEITPTQSSDELEIIFHKAVNNANNEIYNTEPTIKLYRMNLTNPIFLDIFAPNTKINTIKGPVTAMPIVDNKPLPNTSSYI